MGSMKRRQFKKSEKGALSVQHGAAINDLSGAFRQSVNGKEFSGQNFDEKKRYLVKNQVSPYVAF